MWDGHFASNKLCSSESNCKIRIVYQSSQHYTLEGLGRENSRGRKNGMVAMDVIELVHTELESPIRIGSVKDGTRRICVHYGKMNALTILDSYPLLRLNKSIEFAERRNDIFETSC